MATTKNGPIEIYYETFGDIENPAMLLVNGLGSQCINYEEEFCLKIADLGFFVIRFDNRDVGLSSRFDDFTDVVGPGAPYSLSDMGDDAIAVLDDLGIESAHVVGMSMGGMIVQTVVIDHPERFITFTSIMSTTGDPDVGAASDEALKVLLAPMPSDPEAVIELQLAGARAWGSPDSYDVTRLRQHAIRAIERSKKPAGFANQMKAIRASGSRSEALSKVRVPALVLHGSNDNLVGWSGGKRTAEVVAGAKFVTIEGMGHDLPPKYWDEVIGLVTQHALEHQ